MEDDYCTECGDVLTGEEDTYTCFRCQRAIDRKPAGFYWDGVNGTYVDEEDR
jgi:hypothetical protein